MKRRYSSSLLCSDRKCCGVSKSIVESALHLYQRLIDIINRYTLKDLSDQNLSILISNLKEYEDRQLVWEQHEVELERKIARLEKNQDELFDAAQKVSY